MGQQISYLKENAPSDVFTDVFLKSHIHGTDDSRFGLVKRWMKSGDIVRLRRGIYVLGERNKMKGINPYQVAQILYGPSYVSLESALSYHGWIPEAVHSVTSVTTKRAAEIKTPLGLFSYAPVHGKTFFAGVDRIESENGAFLMASPWRAMADYVYVHRKNWKGLKPVVESLRVDPEHFSDFRTLDEVLESAMNRRTRVFLEHCKKGLT
jgi:predicted transcriptional regulator of viral defense system